MLDANLTGASFDHATMVGLDLSQCTLDQARFTQANLSNVDLHGTTLTGVGFSLATLTDANLAGADVRGARDGLHSPHDRSGDPSRMTHPRSPHLPARRRGRRKRRMQANDDDVKGAHGVADPGREAGGGGGGGGPPEAAWYFKYALQLAGVGLLEILTPVVGFEIFRAPGKPYWAGDHPLSLGVAAVAFAVLGVFLGYRRVAADDAAVYAAVIAAAGTICVLIRATAA
jgi:hypothetical protein